MMTEYLPQMNDAAANKEAAFGERLGADGIRFVRRLPASVERVWQALTTAEGIAVWLGRPLVIELRAGGAYEVAFSPADCMTGRILEIETCRRLVLAWREESDGTAAENATAPNDESVVTFEVTPSGADATLLTLTHRYIRDGSTCIGFTAGWHAHLDSLCALVNEQSPVDRLERYATLEPMYTARFAKPERR